MKTSTIERTKTNYKIKDINLADWGWKEILIAEKEMPGLIAIREKYAPQKPGMPASGTSPDAPTKSMTQVQGVGSAATVN